MSETEIKRLIGIWKLPIDYFKRAQYDEDGVEKDECDFCDIELIKETHQLKYSWLCQDHQRELGLRW